MVLYTIPYDKGWKAFVNESEVEIEKVDNSLIAIKINKDVNNVKFTYYPPGLKVGLILTIVSFIILLAYIFLNNKYLIYKKIFSVFYKKQSLLWYNPSLTVTIYKKFIFLLKIGFFFVFFCDIIFT